MNAENGRIQFLFTGDDCTPKEKYTVNIIMKCNYKAGNNSHPETYIHVCNYIKRQYLLLLLIYSLLYLKKNV